MNHAWYLAGPMTGIPHFNFPLFIRAAAELRSHDLDVISPAELDDEETARAAMASLDGSPGTGSPTKETWADFLARDVKLIADSVTGVIFLPQWEQSRGARLEAFVGLLCGHRFARWVPNSGIEEMSKQSVLTQLARVTHREIRNATD